MKGQLSINRVYCSHGDDYMSIRIEDCLSGVVFTEVEISLEGFARALSAEGNIDCDFTLRGIDLVGKKREVKTCKIPQPDIFSEEITENAIGERESDGWEARREDLENRHNFTKDGHIEVVFTRFVNPTEKESDETLQPDS